MFGLQVCGGQDRKAIEAGKAASVLVELKGKSAYASAFCIHPNGFFVTNNHVVESMAVGDTLTLTMNSGTEDHKAIEAKLIRRDAENDLALLKYVGAECFSHAEVGPVSLRV